MSNAKYYQLEEVLAKQVFNAYLTTHQYCLNQKLEFITIDTLFLHLVDTERSIQIFNGLNLNVQQFKANLIAHINENVPKINRGTHNPTPSIYLQKLIETTVFYAEKKGQANLVIDENDLFKSLFQIKDDSATSLFFATHGIGELEMVKFTENNETQDSSSGASTTPTPALDKFAKNLNKIAETKKLDKVYGRDNEISSLISILSRRKKKNPILVGDAGVGKTAIIDGFVNKILSGEVHKSLLNAQVYSVEMNNLIAGARFRGDLEERLGAILNEASKNPNIILFFDEIHTIISNSNQTNGDVASVLKPYLSSGDVRVIGATTFKEYRQYFVKDEAFSRRFQKVDISEPTVELAIQIISSSKASWESFHNITYTYESIQAAVELSHKFITDRKLPDKALDLLDIAGAETKLKGQNIVTAEIIKETLSNSMGIPVVDADVQEKNKLKDLSQTLQNEVFGQEEAIKTVSNMVILSRANIYNREKPVASFLFAGPSGVGKTELAKQLAKNLGIDFVRFDMSEYMENHSVAKFIGSPPGYVGSEKGGKLIDAAKKSPHAVFLFDEIEKAHPNVLNIFLQIMDYGQITDNHGEKADFKNIIVIMTSNMGAEVMDKRTIGFGNNNSASAIENNRTDAIKKQLSPEFFNRLDALVSFNALDTKNVHSIVIKNLQLLQKQLETKGVFLTYDEEVVQWLANKGFDKKYGARPLERCVEQSIAQKLAPEIVFGKISDGYNKVKIIIKNDTLDFQYSKKTKKESVKELSVR